MGTVEWSVLIEVSKQHYLDLALHKRCSWIPGQFCSCHGWGMPPTDCGTPCLIHHCQAVITTLETVVRTDIVNSVVLCMFSKFDCSSVCCQWSVPCSFESMCNWLLCPCLVGTYVCTCIHLLVWYHIIMTNMAAGSSVHTLWNTATNALWTIYLLCYIKVFMLPTYQASLRIFLHAMASLADFNLFTSW